MYGRSFLVTDAHPAARTLARKADEALQNGDRDQVTEFVGRLYNLLDWQVALVWQASVDTAVSRERPFRIFLSTTH